MDITTLIGWVVTVIGAIFTIIAAAYTVKTAKQYLHARPTGKSKAKSKEINCEGLPGKLLRWIMFSIVLALLPLGMKYLSLVTRNHEFSLSNIVSHGELLLITITMCTTAIAELLCSGSGKKLPKLFVGSWTILILIVATGYFADISVAFELGQAEKFSKSTIFYYQVWLFVLSFLFGIACIFLSEN
jgi:hypothetical protein